MRHLLSLEAWTPDEIDDVFAQAHALKRARTSGLEERPDSGAPAGPLAQGHMAAGRRRTAYGSGTPGRALKDKTVALLFEKPSLRTRVSFEVAARELGAETLYLSPQEVGLGSREAVADVARVLSSYVHAVVLRTFSHHTLEDFARYASVPVINGLSDLHHPCQGLADVFTIAEHFGRTEDRTLAYIGDGNNVAHSLLQVAVKCGMHVRIAAPDGYLPDASIVTAARRDAEMTGGSLDMFSDPAEAARDADVLYTDVWTSMGQEKESEERSRIFAPYALNCRLLALADPGAVIMHPLPAHRGQEISDDVLDGPQSVVFTQAENRLHVQKAILRRLLVAAEARVSLSA